VLRGLDPGILLTNVAPMSQAVRESTAELRFSSTLVSIFGLLALTLSVVGLYGVLAHRVRQRLPEFGVRLAFGAAPARIFSMVVGQGMRLVAVGLVAGIALAAGLARLLRGQLVGVGASDPTTYVMITLLFAAVTLVATLLPALRATRTDPAVTLRSE
jgi:ABC-type antimicrobial peptide transport system permease subunit